MNKKNILCVFILTLSLCNVSYASTHMNKKTLPAAAEKILPDDFLIHRPNIVINDLEDPFYSFLIKIEDQSRDALAKLNEDNKRKKDPLESFNLDALKVVGLYVISGKSYATIEDNDGKGYVVSIGNYIGRNNGIIKEINSTGEVVINEKRLSPIGILEDVVTTLSVHSLNNDQ